MCSVSNAKMHYAESETHYLCRSDLELGTYLIGFHSLESKSQVAGGYLHGGGRRPNASIRYLTGRALVSIGSAYLSRLKGKKKWQKCNYAKLGACSDFAFTLTCVLPRFFDPANVHVERE